MLAYHNDPELKRVTLAKIQAHREADRIIQGTYWGKLEGAFRGCAVGCLLEDPKGGHYRYESEFGIPVQLAWLEDGIFESLPVEDSRVWPERFMDAITVGADLSGVWPRFATWLMVDARAAEAAEADFARVGSDKLVELLMSAPVPPAPRGCGVMPWWFYLQIGYSVATGKRAKLRPSHPRTGLSEREVQATHVGGETHLQIVRVDVPSGCLPVRVRPSNMSGHVTGRGAMGGPVRSPIHPMVQEHPGLSGAAA